jgi:transcriptional antiterminator NusG
MDMSKWFTENDEMLAQQMNDSYDDRLYAVFVKTGFEGDAQHFLCSFLADQDATPFVAMSERYYKRAGIISHVLRPLFPGIVFVNTSIQDESFISKIYKCCRESENIFRLLSYDRSFDAAVRDDERRFLDSLWDGSNFKASVSKGRIKGGVLEIMSGPLVGMEQAVRRINRHRMTALVEVGLLDVKREITLGLEVAEKVP